MAYIYIFNRERGNVSKGMLYNQIRIVLYFGFSIFDRVSFLINRLPKFLLLVIIF